MDPSAQQAQHVAPARHAQVVPSFVLPLLSRNLECRSGTISPGELVRWEQAADLSESVRQDLRNTVIRRIRAKTSWFVAQPIGVRLVDGWTNRLKQSDVSTIETLLSVHSGKEFEQLTFDQYRAGFGSTLKRQLHVLALLEAIYWSPPPRPAQRSRVNVLPQPEPPVPKANIGALADRVLSLPWISRIEPHDLRFAYAGPAPLDDWLRQQLGEASVPSHVAQLLKKLNHAADMTAAQEAIAVTMAAGVDCLPQTHSDATVRWPAIFLARHISGQGIGQTLAQVGTAFGLTRERVRQICEAFEDVLQRSQVATPSLDRALAAIARITPCGVHEANEQLARFIGEGAGVEALIAWARLCGKKEVGIRCQRVRRRLRGQIVDTKMVERANAQPWVKDLVDHVSRDTMMFGCTNIIRVSGLLALKQGVSPGQEAIETALMGSDVFRWLDKETGWFTLGETDVNSAASRVRKIMAVAHDHVGADEIAGALASDDGLIYRAPQSLGLAVPPVHVLRELLATWSWLEVVQKRRFAPSDSFDGTNALTDAEKLAVDVIEKYHGVACRFEIREEIEQKLDSTNMAVSVMLGSSPIFKRVEHGLYRLIGRRMGDSAIAAARARMRSSYSEHVLNKTPVPGVKDNEFVLRVTQASVKNEQYHVPARWLKKLAGQRIAVHGDDGAPLGQARITLSGSMSGLQKLFNPVEGDLYLVAVNEGALRVKLLSTHLPQEAN